MEERGGFGCDMRKAKKLSSLGLVLGMIEEEREKGEELDHVRQACLFE